MTEPKIHISRAIWDKEGCNCNRVIAEMHKVKENDTCERWEEETDE